ncbi:hypothetical protein SAMN05660750_04431 [Bosea thiooxidans]|uniref:Uncharacterized protein n=1 Tax=Bosea thiooxidans TaxID=53254 RepID=A0A1T5GV34_9HYPH|nr:hypothetical protein [Bosea thiooxidans]SKC12257.1 hypothetical protein SAMN05660750_04431 [Bosea thiooxidans]
MIGYEVQIVAVAQLYILFLLYAVACWVLARSTLSHSHWLPAFIASAAILGPVTLGLLLTLLFWLVPGRSPRLYVAILAAAPLLIGLLRFRLLASDVRRLHQSWKERSFASIALWGVLLFAMPALCLAFELLVLPLHGNDPLEYMQLGRLLYEQRAAHIYPLKTALPSSGFIAPWTHPPTYGSLIALAFMLQGTSAIAGAAKLISFWFAIASAALATALVFASDRRPSWRLWLTPFLAISVPVYFEIALTAHIDAIRIATFVAAICLTIHAVTNGTRSAFLLAAYAISGAAMTHSIGILAIAIALPMLVICWRGSIRRLVEGIVIIALTVAVVTLPHYLRNVAIFGSPIQDSVPVWDLPNLGVSEFLRGERGLETFADRLVLGVMMPFTRTDLFGFLPSAGTIIAALILLRNLARPDRRAIAIATFKARSSDAAIPLLISLLGYLSVIFLSVLAGTDLAVKNARYMLTVIPMTIALVMIGLGRLVPDKAIAKGYYTLTSRLGRFAPSSRQRDVAAPKDFVLTLPVFASCLLVAILIAFQLYDVFRLSYANMRVYFSNEDMISRRLLETEHAKRDGSVLDEAAIEGIARKQMAPDDMALSFRQASFGFYSSPRFRFHVDTSLTDMFVIKDPLALRDALVKRGLKWIYTPGYSLPEINNSAFAALLRDPRLIRPIARSNGWGLYRVRETDAPVEQTEIAKAVPMVREGTQLYATTDQGPGFVDGERTKLTLDPQRGVAELTRVRGLVKQLRRWDAILSKPIRTQHDPNVINASDFELTDEGRILLEATLSGSGLADMIVEYVSYPPIARRLGDLQINDDLIGSPRLIRETIWSGLLTDAPKRVGGWLVPALSRIGTSDQRTKRGVRVVFRLRDGNILRVHDWTAHSVVFSAGPQAESDRVSTDAVNKGWVFSATSLNPRLGLQLRTQASSGAVDERWPFPPLGLQRLSGAASLVSPPPFRPPSDVDTGTRDDRVEKLFKAGDLRINLKASLFGYGRITPALLIKCRLEPIRNFSLLTVIPIKQKDEVQTLDLPSIQLWADKTENISWVLTPPCIPRSLRVVFQNERQLFLAIEQSVADIGKQQYGYVDIHRIEASLTSDAARSGLALPLIPFAETGVPTR